MRAAGRATERAVPGGRCARICADDSTAMTQGPAARTSRCSLPRSARRGRRRVPPRSAVRCGASRHRADRRITSATSHRAAAMNRRSPPLRQQRSGGACSPARSRPAWRQSARRTQRSWAQSGCSASPAHGRRGCMARASCASPCRSGLRLLRPRPPVPHHRPPGGGNPSPQRVSQITARVS